MNSCSLRDAIGKVIQSELGLSLRDNQWEMGQALFDNQIAELATGEGKSVASIYPLVVLAQSGKTVFFATANDYLAHRDSHLFQSVFERFSLRVGLIQAGMPEDVRRKAYAANIVYGTLREFGFDYLRDQVQQSQKERGFNRSERIQPPLDVGILDEADCILIDEATLPLVLSQPVRPVNGHEAACYAWSAQVSDRFQIDEHFVFVNESREVALTPAGQSRLYRLPMPSGMSSCTLLEITHAVERAIYVSHSFARNHHYIVRDGQVMMVDIFTGRTQPGRKWSHGIQQAIEAREGLALTPESVPQAQIETHAMVKKFCRLSGMTGTAMEVEQELKQAYGLKIKQIASNVPSRVIRLPEVVCRSHEEKWDRIVAETRSNIELGRAVLIGTPTVQDSMQLAVHLQHAGLEPAVLNACNPFDEAAIIAQAGQKARVTVATNMAGRGTDIPIAPNVRSAGGLHVMGTDLHAASRIDRQLAGRCGRQGDPGSFRQYMSWDDRILTAAWGAEKQQQLRKKWIDRDTPLQTLRIFLAAQRDLENRCQVRITGA